ncbi:hypothetical protein [Tenacibaculum amylolyticum]|uniref:hypothetical protein n=1 Tax=Tenacibaculum amylolyticum TaxID=104269 RepID=UPI0038959A3B
MADQNNTPVIIPRYYPKLSSILVKEDIPDILGFVKDGIVNLFDNIHYKDLQYNKSPRGDAAFYSLSIISKKRLDIEIPGTGIYLILNPDPDGDFNISAFPITVEYEWKILSYLRSFNLDQFDFSPQAFFEIALRALSISEEQAVTNFINTFTVPVDDTVTALEQFVNDINEANSGITLPTPTEDTSISTIVTELYSQSGNYASFIGFATYILKNDLEETKRKLKAFFESLLPEDIEEYIKDILIPKFSASLELSAGIEFPRNLLQPVYPVDHPTHALLPLPIENAETGHPLAGFTFGKALFYANTENGFGYQVDLELNTMTPVMIGNSGIILNIERLKVDLSDTENIREADLEGRPATFKGVYADEVSVTLPAQWFDGGDNHPGTTAKLGGYSMLIGSGGISGTIILEAIQIGLGVVSSYYEDNFKIQYPIEITANSETKTIASYSELLVHLNSLNGASYQFTYPFSVFDLETQALKTFNIASEYATYINGLPSNTPPPRLVKKFGENGFEIWFTSFDISFQQGKVTESNIKGGLKIPRLKDAKGDIASIEISGHIDDGGGFNLTASEQDGFEPINVFDLFKIYINSLEIGRDSGDEPFYLGTSCDIEFTNPLIRSFLGDRKLGIDRLRIYSDGSLEIEGGSIPLPKSFPIPLGPIDMMVTAIHFGSFQEEHNGVMRKYNYFGFDGAISMGLIGVEGRGEGLKYFYTVDDGPGKEPHSYISIQTIEVDLTIPGNASASEATAIINGWLSVNDVEYAGGVSLKLPKLKMAGGASMRLQPKEPAFLIDAHLEIPTPIPLGATGLGISGFRGIMGFRYVAEKEAVGLHSHDDKWYDYYTHPPRGIHASKFNGPDKTESYTNPVTLGAGVTIGTVGASDVISLRVMVLLSIPNLLMIDGRASILSKEWGLDDKGEPPFFAFMILADNGIEIGAGVDFKLPGSSGSIIDMHAYMQAGFFWDNLSGWYLNLGTREDPIAAKVLSLVEMQAFLMLSSSGIAAGAKVIFDIRERFGPIRVEAWLIAEVGGFISFERPQIGGYMGVDAGGTVDLFGIIEVSISFSVFFAVEAASPFLIYAEIRVCGSIKIWFVRIRICARVKIKWEKNRRVDRTPIPPITPILAPLPALTNEVNDQAAKGIHMLTGETFELINFGEAVPNANSDKFDEVILPLDTYVDIKFDKSLIASSEVANVIGSYNNPPENYEDLIPPVKVIKGNELRQVKHRYEITDVSIKAAKEGSSTWVDYHPYEALLKGEGLSEQDYNGIGNLRIGHWQKSSKEYNAIRILATSPFSYTEQGEPGWFIPEQIGLTHRTFFCEGTRRDGDCVNWLNSPLNSSYYTQTNFPYYHSHQGVFFNVSQGQRSNVNGVVMNSGAQVVNDLNTFGFKQSLKFPNTSALEFKLPKPSREVTLKLSTAAEGVKVIYYKSYLPEGAYRIEYLPVASVNYTPLELADSEGVKYTNTSDAISKIEIYPISADQFEIDRIYEQIEALFLETYEEYGSEIPLEAEIEIPANSAEYNRLLGELDALLGRGCSTNPPPIRRGIGYMEIQASNFTQKRFEVGKTVEEPVVSDSSCNPCELHGVLLDHYNNCFTDEAEENEDYNIECLEEFLNFITGCGTNTAPVVTGITFPDGNCCENVVTGSGASVSPLVTTGSGNCNRGVEFTIIGAPNEVIKYDLIFNPPVGRNQTNVALTLDSFGRGTVNTFIGAGHSAQATGVDEVRLNIINTASSNKTARVSMSFSNCPV